MLDPIKVNALYWKPYLWDILIASPLLTIKLLLIYDFFWEKKQEWKKNKFVSKTTKAKFVSLAVRAKKRFKYNNKLYTPWDLEKIYVLSLSYAPCCQADVAWRQLKPG